MAFAMNGCVAECVCMYSFSVSFILVMIHKYKCKSYCQPLTFFTYFTVFFKSIKKHRIIKQIQKNKMKSAFFVILPCANRLANRFGMLAECIV